MPIVTGDLKFKKSLHSVAAGVDNGNTHDLEVNSLGLGVSADELASGELNDLFDAVSSSEASDGRVEYRCIYVVNEHATLTLYDAKLFMAENTASSESIVEIGLDPVAVNGEDSAIALVDEVDTNTDLSAVTWGDHPSFAGGLAIGNLAAGEQRAVWVRRTILAGAGVANESATVALRGDTDA
ncbi:hypothetical protein VPHK567_0428 [Vibrio phage K567]